MARMQPGLANLLAGADDAASRVVGIRGKLANSSDGPAPDTTYQYIFSTACSANADISSEVLVHSFWRSGTAGSLSRLDACNVQLWRYPRVWFRPYKIVVYARATGEADQNAMLLNKPWLLTRWVRTAPADCRVIVMDLDFVVQADLGQLLFGPGAPHGALAGTRRKPSGALYMYGTIAFAPRLRRKGVRRQCDALWPANDCGMSDQTAWKSYMLGPPHVMHIDDLAKVAPLWLNETARRLDAEKAAWAMDMPTYSHAAAVYGLRHEVSPSLMVSDPSASSCSSEGWAAPDAQLGGGSCPLAGCCQPRPGAATGPPPLPVIHFCQFYNAMKLKPSDTPMRPPGRYFGKYEFSARHGGSWGKLSPLSCAQPMPTVLPRDDEFVDGVMRNASAPLHQRRQAWMVSRLLSAHNDAFAHFHATCPNAAKRASTARADVLDGAGGDGRGRGESADRAKEWF